MLELRRFAEYRERVVDNCAKIIVGKDDVITLVLVCFLCSGHVLLEDVPGTGKTMLLRSFARGVGGDFKRIQFTPDLLPSDLTGINFYNQKTGEFQFRPGPLFANIILADEINRATPRTQSSLLRDYKAFRAVSRDGHPKPLGVLRHLPAPGGPDRPLLHAPESGVYDRRAGDERPGPAYRRRTAGHALPRGHRRRDGLRPRGLAGGADGSRRAEIPDVHQARAVS